jgi:GTP-binding protein
MNMKLPLVTIVGRANVGKSTLFNRILRKREAIVDDVPGVTRDRHFANTDWNGKPFTIVDTGGYLPKTKEFIENAVREQVEIAIAESDIILFVVDQSTGISDIDQHIAEKLKRYQTPTLLLVNKIDHQMLETEGYQFYNLGIGEPILISAAQGRGIGDMLDILSDLLEKVPPESKHQKDIVKLAIIGKENVGKSSFVNTIIGEERIIVTPVPGTTRDAIDTLLKYNKHEYLLIDTAGLKRRTKVKENVLFYGQLRTLRSIQRADIVLYFIDAVEGLTKYDLLMLNETVHSKKSVILIVNKWDLIPKDDKTLNQTEINIRERLGTLFYIPIVFTSVLQKIRLYKVMDTVAEIYLEMKKKIRTADLNDTLIPIIEKNSPPAVRGKEIKINYITQIKSAPPLFAFFGNHPQLIPDNYKRFLEKQIRNFWGFKGIPVNIVFKSKHKSKRK